MTLSSDRLYKLLPAIYRERDFDRQELRSLMALIEHELSILEGDVDELYENWFIETCADWVVPYIGDLLGVSGVSTRSAVTNPRSNPYGQQEQRAYVANTLAYRRRKGTAPVVEQLARDVTGWRARAVEFFDRLAISQNVNHIRSGNTTVDLRVSRSLQRLGTPFEQQVAYTAEVRQQGRYNIPNLGLFLWRLQSYPITKGNVSMIQTTHASLRDRCYTFNCLGDLRVNLFNPPQTETEIIQLAEEVNVPGKLRADPTYAGYQAEPPVFQIFINRQPKAIPAQEVLITDLPIDENTQLTDLQQNPSEFTQPPTATKVVAVNPELGRMAFLNDKPPSKVDVTYAYGFSGDIGGGSYDRSASIAPLWASELWINSSSAHASREDEAADYFSPLYWEVEQARSSEQNPLAEAVQTWNGTVQAWQNLHDLTHIPLARIAIPKVRASQSQTDIRSTFHPGILKGLTTIATVGTDEVIINAGLAIDAQGRAIEYDQTDSLRLSQLNPRLRAERMLWIVLSYWATAIEPRYQLNVISQTQAEQFSEGTYLRLVGLSVDAQGKIETSFTPQSGSFQPGIVQGLTVLTPPETLQAIVTPGMAVDQSGQTILLDRNVPIDLRDYQNQMIVLAIVYSEMPADANWQIHILLKTELERFPDRYPQDVYIQLAEIFVPVVKLDVISDHKSNLRPVFAPGIVQKQDLKVQAEQGARGVAIAAGRAIDAKGQEITLDRPYRLGNLGRYRNQTVTLAIAARSQPWEPNWEIKFLSAKEEADPTSKRYLPLARLSIGLTGKLTASPIDLRPQFKPGVIRDLTIIPTSNAKISVSAGQAVDRLGRLIHLEEPYVVDFSKHPGRELVLFVTRDCNQGWKPLDVKHSETSQSWQHLGAVPVEPKRKDDDSKKKGVILVKDNQTYTGDLTILMPSTEQLQTQLSIIAANGYRPHLRGNLSVRGIVPTNARKSLFQPGELLIDGFLIEGKLTIQPGYLKQLGLAHCTLVPHPRLGLEVKSALLQSLTSQEEPNRYFPEDEPPEGWGLIAIVIYGLTMLKQLIQLSFDRHDLPPQQRLRQLTHFLKTEFVQVCHALEENLSQCQRSENGESDSTDSLLCSWLCLDSVQTDLGTHDELAITIDRSICGRILLAESVPELSIQDSMIDIGTGENGLRPIGKPAIVAPGAKVKIQTTTVLGTTRVRSLSASDSIFDGLVSVLDRQEGCMRFCYVPLSSKTPSRYRCQPDLALQELPTLPAAITAIAIEPIHKQVFLGTSGRGIFQQSKDDSWKGSSNSTALMACSALLTSLHHGTERLPGTGEILSMDTTVNGINTKFTTELRKGNTIIANNQIRTVISISNNNQNIDKQLKINAPFDQDLLSGTTFEYSNRGQGTITSANTIVTGKETAFSHVLEVGSILIAQDQIRTVREFALNISEKFEPELQQQPFFFIPKQKTGKISSDRTIFQVSNSIVLNNLNLRLGDIVLAADQRIRTITDIYDNQLRVNEPFSETIPETTTIFFPHRLTGRILSDRITFQISPNTILDNLNLAPGSILLSADQRIRTISGISGNDLTVDEPFGREIPEETSLFIAQQGTGTISSIDDTVIGNGQTNFSNEVADNDILIAQKQIRIVTSYSNTIVSIDNPFQPDLKTETIFWIPSKGKGNVDCNNVSVTNSSDDRALTMFQIELNKHDLIIIGNEIRVIESILSDDTLIVNEPFSHTLANTPFFFIPSKPMVWAGTENGGIYRSVDGGETWTSMSHSRSTKTAITALTADTQSFKDPILLAGTDGDGVFKFSESTKSWTLMEGLPNRDINALSIDTNRRILVGTGGGLFRRTVQPERWRSINRGLENEIVTTLAIANNGQIFAGTEAGQVFRLNPSGNRWSSASRNLPGATVTSLAIQALTGKVSVDGMLIRGEALQILSKGSAITIQGQTRIVGDLIQQANGFERKLDREFCPEVSGEVTFTSSYLFAGTAGSGIFRSSDHGENWESVTPSLRLGDRSITTIAINTDTGTILAGTSIGSVLCSTNYGNSWLPRNQGLPDVENTIPILSRIQPIWTSPDRGQPGYGQLSQTCAQAIRRGAEDSSEMGAFHFLKQPQREENLRAVLKEYLRFGLKAGIFYMT